MIRLLFAIALTSATIWVVSAPPQEANGCGDGWTKVWEEGRYVCEPEEKTVAVFESECIAKIEPTKESRIYMGLDWQGKLNHDDWRSEH